MKRLIIIILIAFSYTITAQEDRFYIRTVSNAIEIPVQAQDSVVTYTGDDLRLKTLFEKHDVKIFRGGFKYATRDKLKRTFYAIAATPAFQQELKMIAPDIFEFS
ncbi:hypothetical protein, partial [Dokdonia donghaensis]|uniref:hypothetical protein n=1 Tax=Dokdonia donghaensis TaxID=326320 RepID=UPI0035C8717E